MQVTKKQIKEASIAHAKKVLGEDQFSKNKDAKKAIASDFLAGVEWIHKATTKQLN